MRRKGRSWLYRGQGEAAGAGVAAAARYPGEPAQESVEVAVLCGRLPMQREQPSVGMRYTLGFQSWSREVSASFRASKDRLSFARD